MREFGSDAVELSCLDVADKVQAELLVSQFSSSPSSEILRGVWHSALVLKDVTFGNMTEEAWDAVMKSKVGFLYTAVFEKIDVPNCDIAEHYTSRKLS